MAIIFQTDSYGAGFFLKETYRAKKKKPIFFLPSKIKLMKFFQKNFLMRLFLITNVISKEAELNDHRIAEQVGKFEENFEVRMNFEFTQIVK